MKLANGQGEKNRYPAIVIETEGSKVRVELNPMHLSELKEVQHNTGLDLQAVFNEAVTLYVLAVRRKAEGKPIAFIDEQNHTYTEIEMPGLKNVQPNAAP